MYIQHVKGLGLRVFGPFELGNVPAPVSSQLEDCVLREARRVSSEKPNFPKDRNIPPKPSTQPYRSYLLGMLM